MEIKEKKKKSSSSSNKNKLTDEFDDSQKGGSAIIKPDKDESKDYNTDDMDNTKMGMMN
jgi:hypothetical protein